MGLEVVLIILVAGAICIGMLAWCLEGADWRQAAGMRLLAAYPGAPVDELELVGRYCGSARLDDLCAQPAPTAFAEAVAWARVRRHMERTWDAGITVEDVDRLCRQFNPIKILALRTGQECEQALSAADHKDIAARLRK